MFAPLVPPEDRVQVPGGMQPLVFAQVRRLSMQLEQAGSVTQ